MDNRRYTPKYSKKSRTSSSTTRRSTRNSSRSTQHSSSNPYCRPLSGSYSRYSREDADLYEDYYRSSARRPSTSRNRTPKKKQKTGCAVASLYFVIIFGISICLSLFCIFAANDVLALIKTDQDISITIKEDTTVNQIGKILDQSGVVNYGILFNVFNTLQGEGDVIISSGSYTLNSTMDYSQIVRALTQTTSTTSVKITIPEGYTINQIQQTLLENNITSPNLLNNALNEYPYKHEFLKTIQPPKDHWLEGYLFPDTYEFIQDSKQPVYEVVNVMLNNFDSKYNDAIKQGAEKLELSMHEVVTIASLIEKEAKEKDEFSKISGVIHNRLRNSKNFPYLQIDASLQYAVGHNNKLTNEDKKLDSPYNLYLYKGLPPGPICNPGYDALYAATHPDKHGYYYYVAMPDGTHLFAKTNNQHNKNRQRADQAWADAS